jgi:hypothetical protein
MVAYFKLGGVGLGIGINSSSDDVHVIWYDNSHDKIGILT